LEQILFKVLSKEPASRYRTADQLGRVLASIQQPEPQGSIPSVTRPSAPYAPPLPVLEDTRTSGEEELDTSLQFDWMTLSLGLLATLAVGGLIPYWLYVWFTLNPPVR
jgi:serine/threonine-protein kinase